MIGVGAIGTIIASELAINDRVDEVRLCDINVGRCKQLATELKSSKLSVHRVDASKTSDLLRAAKRSELVVNTTLPEFNLRIMDCALKSGAKYQDLVGGVSDSHFLRNVLSELRLGKKWKEAGLTALIAAGSAPGTVNVMAANACEEFDRVDSVRFRLFDRIESNEIVSAWSPQTMWEDMAGKPVVYEDGEYKILDPFSGEETYDFPDNIGPQIVYNHMHSEPITLPRYVDKGLRYADLKIASPELAVIKFLTQLGLADEKPIIVKGKQIVPRDVLLTLTPSPLSPKEVIKKMEEGVLIDAGGCYVIEIEGWKKDKKIRRVSYMPYLSLREVSKRLPGATHESYITGLSAAIFATMLASDDIKTQGVIPPEAIERQVRDDFLKRLAERGLVVHTRTVSL